MKRYEMMNKKEIINLLCFSINDCGDCPLDKELDCVNGNNCGNKLSEYLNEDIPTKKVIRASTLKTAEDVISAKNKFNEDCENRSECDICPYSPVNFPHGGLFDGCFVRYFAEEIEVEE